MTEWLKDDIVWQPPNNFKAEDVYGFVYLITNLKTNRKYIGKKWFWATKTLPITKSRKRKKKTIVESNWRKYYGSNKYLQEEVIILGPDAFKREILHLCKTKGECSYMELKEQVEREVLFSDDYYNGIIACKISSSHIKNMCTLNE